MNWKAEAMEKLCRYDAMRQSVINLQEEIQRLEQEAYSLRSMNMEKTLVRKRGCSKEDVLLSNLVQRQELSAALEQAVVWLRIADRALAALSPEEKLILNRFYVYPERGGVDRLCEELQVEQSSIYRKRDKALRKFTYALYGICES